jgi:A118 family predicted phage portal protein
MAAEDFFHDWTPTFREENILRALDAVLMRIEDLTGLSRGTLSNPQTEARTATELKILKQRSYATVCDIQKATKNALEHTVYIMDVLCTLYELAPEGEHEVSFDWDDSIVSDRDKQFIEYQQLEGMGIISKAKMYAWYFGTTEEEALKNIPEQVKIDPFGGAV